jgi:hypothetical protein
VYTVCPEYWDVLYPNFLKKGGSLDLGYTGYISDELIKRANNDIPINCRSIEVCYRASKLRPNFGRLGLMKSEIANLFLEATKEYNLKTDISIKDRDVIPGRKWLNFIESSKCTLGSNSGSSVLDPEGEIRRCVYKLLDKRPGTTFIEAEKRCFPEIDGRYIFTAISPRVLEAGLLKTAQLLVEGPYSGFIEPWHHYIPLKENLSNIDEVIIAIKDDGFLEYITENCKDQLLTIDELRIVNYVKKILQDLSRNEKYHLARNAITERHLIKHSAHLLRKGFLIWLIDDLKKFIERYLPFVKILYRKLR